MKTALKERKETALSTLRMVLAAIRNQAIKKNVAVLDDADVIKVIQTQIRQHKESIEQFMKGNRQDLAKKEAEELTVLLGYVPKAIEKDELAAIVDGAIKSTGASCKSDFGKVMKAVMAEVKGRAEGKVIQQLVNERLQKRSAQP